MRCEHSKTARRSAHISRRGKSTSSLNTRPLRFESLEDRRLLAITVNSLVDELDGSIIDGDISLRDAIAASPSGGEINFSVTGTIGLSLGQLTIDKDLTINGPGANQLTIGAGSVSRVLRINSGIVDLSGLTFTGGQAEDGNFAGVFHGGGLFNGASANTTLTGMVIQGNGARDAAGGIWNSGTLQLVRSTISGNNSFSGGGILNAGPLSVFESTISNNSGTYGGGIFNGSTLTISHSTLSGNSATGRSSAVGGGIFNQNGVATLTHTLVTGNSAPTGSEIHHYLGGTVNLNAFNLIGESSKTTAQALVGVTAGATDILATSNGTTPTALAAIIAPLANNGGPTRTHALVPGSPAINAGNPSFTPPPISDQRGAGFPRVAMGRIDIGAFEVQPLNLVVDTLTDESDGDYSVGDLSLREALQLANGFAGADTVSFAPSLAGGTINLALGQLTIADSTTVTGLGANQLTINAGGASRVMSITSGTVNVSGLTLTGGISYQGGGLQNHGGTNTTLADVVIQGNTAYAGNYAGGGVFNLGNLTITRSTIASNTAPNGGSQGGGVFNLGGAVNIVNSTVSGNTAVQLGGGVRNLGGTISIWHSTLTSNSTINPGGLGGGIFIGSGLVTLGHTIVAGNSAGVGEEIFRDGGGGIIVGNYNLFGESTISTGQALIGFGPGPTDRTATFDGSVPTALGAIITPLANNGGPTQTHALVAGSPAIDAGNPGFTPPPNSDQRGAPYARVFDGSIDIGAYEVQSLDMIVDTLTDESDGNYSAGDLSLREAMQLANANVGADMVSFDAGLAGGAINIASQLPTITEAVTITGLGANLLTINAGNGTDDLPATLDGYRIFVIDNGSASLIDVAISGLTLTGGDTLGRGGAILNRENLTLTASTVSGNASDGGGGVANSGGGTLSVTSSTISGNRAGNAGGIANFGGTVNLTNSTVSDNHAGFAGLGGGIYSRDGGTLNITGSTISGNSAGDGGGILTNLGTATITGSTITGNAAMAVGGSGGGISSYLSTPTISSSLITGNSGPVGSEISILGMANLNGFNLIGDSSKTTAQAFFNVYAGATDILATSDGTNPTSLAAIIAPLANNGGPTKTHALVAGSPARDAGNPSFTTPPNFDQRGTAYDRVVNGRVDIGALEVQAPSADFDGDGDVDGRDFMLWQRGFGTPAPTAVKSNGDADNDLDVDGPDLSVWQLQYDTVPGPLVAELEEETGDGGQGGEESGIDHRTLSTLNSDEPRFLDSPTTSWCPSSRNDNRLFDPVFEDSYVEEVDRAIEQLATVPNSARSFGQMVARREVKRIAEFGLRNEEW